MIVCLPQLPVELLRLAVDHLGRADQAAAALSCRALRDAVALPSLNPVQRLAAALRSPLMPWKRLARDHLVPSELHNLLLVAHELNHRRPHRPLRKLRPRPRAKKLALGPGAPSEWTFYRLHEATERSLFGIVGTKDIQRIVALAPRQRRRRRRTPVRMLERNDLVTEYTLSYTEDGLSSGNVEHVHCSLMNLEGKWEGLSEVYDNCFRVTYFSSMPFEDVIPDPVARETLYVRILNRDSGMPVARKLACRCRFINRSLPPFLTDEASNLEDARVLSLARMLIAHCPEEGDDETGVGGSEFSDDVTDDETQ